MSAWDDYEDAYLDRLFYTSRKLRRRNNLANKNTTVFLRGYIYWAKIFGDPRPNYNRDGREWTFEFEPQDLEAVKAAGLQAKLKDKSDKKGYENRAPFMTLKQKE